MHALSFIVSSWDQQLIVVGMAEPCVSVKTISARPNEVSSEP
jgi:hypothetical protein